MYLKLWGDIWIYLDELILSYYSWNTSEKIRNNRRKHSSLFVRFSIRYANYWKFDSLTRIFVISPYDHLYPLCEN